MIERRQIDHIDLVQLGKTLLLLFKRQELLVDLPSTSQTTEEIVPTERILPTEELREDLESSGDAAAPPIPAFSRQQLQNPFSNFFPGRPD
jgi:hypothetical protein